MNIRTFASILPTLFLSILCSDFCVAEKTLVFSCFPDSPPLSYEKNNTVKGFLPDIFSESAKRSGIKIKIRLYPIKRLLNYLKTGDNDGSIALAKNKDRNFLIYSETPVLKSRTLIFVRKGYKFKFTRIQDLFGKRFVSMFGWKTVRNNEFLKAVYSKSIFIQNVSSHKSALKMLLANRVDGLVGTEIITWYHANTLKISDNLVSLDLPISKISVYFTISKNSKNVDNPEILMKKLELSLKEVLSDGTCEKLQRIYKVKSLN